MSILTRRQLLQAAGGGAAALVLSPLSALAAEDKKEGFTLPDLPYKTSALEPHIDEETMKIHHDKHHKAYVDNLNNALKGMDEFLSMPIDKLVANLKMVPEKARTAVRNNGGGHANHSMFWKVMGPAPKGDNAPSGDLAKAIDKKFDSLEKFKAAFKQAAVTRFGSGWAWLALVKGKLDIVSTPNQDTPLMEGNTPILGIDVWEHAYYLKYKNLRPVYVDAWWNVVNWNEVGKRYEAAAGK